MTVSFNRDFIGQTNVVRDKYNESHYFKRSLKDPPLEIASGGLGKVFENINTKKLFKRSDNYKDLDPESADHYLLELSGDSLIPAQINYLTRIGVLAAEDVNEDSELVTEPKNETDSNFDVHEEYLPLVRAKGKGLDNLIDNNELDFTQSLKIVINIFKALAEFHKINAIHNDVAPQNIFADDNANVQFIDLGLSKSRNNRDEIIETDNESGFVDANPGYVCPWRMRTNLVDVQTDLYSALIVMFELLGSFRNDHLDDAIYKNDAMMIFSLVSNEKISDVAEKFIKSAPNEDSKVVFQSLIKHLKPVLEKISFPARIIDSKSYPTVKRLLESDEFKTRSEVTAQSILDALYAFLDENNLNHILDENKFNGITYNNPEEISSINSALALAKSNLAKCLQSEYRKDYTKTDRLIIDIENKFLAKAKTKNSQINAIKEFLDFSKNYKEYYLLKAEYDESFTSDIKETYDTILKAQNEELFEQIKFNEINLEDIASSELYIKSLNEQLEHNIKVGNFFLGLIRFMKNEIFDSAKKDFIRDKVSSSSFDKIDEVAEELKSSKISSYVKLLKDYLDGFSNRKFVGNLLNNDDFNKTQHMAMIRIFRDFQEQIAQLETNEELTQVEKHDIIRDIYLNMAKKHREFFNENYRMLQSNIDLIQDNNTGVDLNNQIPKPGQNIKK